MSINRLLPVIIPFFVLILLEIFFFNPKMVYVILVLVNLLIFFPVWKFTKASKVDKKWWNFLILPNMMSIAIIMYVILLSNKFAIQLLFILNIVLLYYYLRYIYYYLINPALYKSLSIENISSYGNLLTIFLFSTAIYGLQSFLNIQAWILISAILIINGLIIYQVMWANKIDLSESIIYIFIGCLIIVELSWSVSFLPLNHQVSGLTIAICYYMIIGLIRHFLLGKLNKQIVKSYLGFGFISLFIILITARWL